MFHLLPVATYEQILGIVENLSYQKYRPYPVFQNEKIPVQ